MTPPNVQSYAYIEFISTYEDNKKICDITKVDIKIGNGCFQML